MDAPVIEDERDELDKNLLQEELAGLRKTPINRSTVAGMSSGELASVLAASVVKYDVLMVEQFEDMRFRLRELLVREWIEVADLVTGTDEGTKQDRDDIVAVVLKGRAERIARKMKRRFDEFTKRIKEDGTNATA